MAYVVEEKCVISSFRLLALRFGCDIVYTEEIIDFRLLRSTRIDNKVLGTVDYVDR